MVAFTRIPYDEAVRRAEKQDRILTRVVAVAAAGLLGVTALLAKAALQRRYPDSVPKVTYSVSWPQWATALTTRRA